MRLQKGSDFTHRDCGCTIERKVIDTGADGREGDRAAVVFCCESKAVAIAVREQVILPALPAVPDRSRCVDDVPRRQSVSAGDLGLSGFASAQRAALCQKFRARRAMDGTIHTTAAQKACVGRVDNRVGLNLGDISLNDLDSCLHHTDLPLYFMFSIRRARAACQRHIGMVG